MTVTDGKKGTLNTSVKFYLNGAEVASAGQEDDGEACVTARGGLKITNTYVPEESDKVKTGDDNKLMVYLFITILGAAMLAGAVIYRRRREDE